MDNTVNKIKIGNIEYDLIDTTSGYSQVSISDLLPTGIHIGTLILNNQSYEIYAPNTSGSATGLDVSVGGTNLSLNNL